MATITVKNIPDDLYGDLKERARAHRRSVNGELIHCLEELLRPRPLPVENRLARIRALRPGIDPRAVDDAEIRDAIAGGRP